MREERKGKVWKGWVSLFLGAKAKPLPSKQSVKFKCQIWSEITEKFAKKCLDVSRLCLSRKISA